MRPYMSIKANILLNISEIPRKQTAFATNGSPVFLNQHLTKDHKSILVRRMKRSQHGDNVNGGVAI